MTDLDRWNLKPIYAGTEDWEAALTRIEDGIDELRPFSDAIGDGADRLADCLDLLFLTLKDMQRASSYASMTYDENTRDAEAAAMAQRARLLGTTSSEAVSFLSPAIKALGQATIDDYLASEPRLDRYRHYLHDTLRRAEHTRSAAEEEIIAGAGLMSDAPYSIYGMLTNADIDWPMVTLSTGEDVVLDQSGYSRHRAAADRGDRELVFDTFWKAWQGYARTMGVMLFSQMKRDLFYARVRGYENCLENALDADRVPEAVYRTLVSEAQEHLPVLHRYFRLRGRILGIEELRYFDIYPPLVQSDLAFPLEAGKGLVLDSMAPLGAAAVDVVREGFDSQWMDAYPRKGKRSGGYMNGSVYDVHPFVLMNYNDDWTSVSTLSHEWGHALHSCLSNEAQPYVNSSYSIFLAEVASTLNEALLLDRALQEAASPTERLFYLGSALEGLRGTFFRQAMFAEFELAIHERVEEGETLTGETLTEMYGELLRRYHGHEDGVVHIDDEYAVEWAYIPHFYYDFYVYQYATSIAASSLLADRILADGSGAAVEDYLDLLRAGGSEYPFDLLLQAGVDLADPAPYRSLMRRMERIMDEIEVILDD